MPPKDSTASHLYSIDLPPSDLDTKSLKEELRKNISGEVRFDDGSRALYAADASNYRQIPIGVVLPKNIEDVISTVRIARSFGAPLLSRGGGTSIPGQCVNAAIVMDFSKYMNGIIALDPQKKLATVQPGCVLDTLRAEAEKHKLTFGPDPATHKWCTLGGMIGNNSCGVHSVMAGRTADNVESLDILTYDGHRMTVGKTSDEELRQIIQQGGRRGEIYQRLQSLRDTYAQLIRERYPKIPRRVSGYNLDDLLPEKGLNVARALVGTEGTCVTVLEATVQLMYSPPKRVLAVLGFEDMAIAGDYVPEVLAFGPIGLEGMDEQFMTDMRRKSLRLRDLELMPKGRGYILAEFGAETIEEANDKARKMVDALSGKNGFVDSVIYDDAINQKGIWAVRESGLGATARIPGEKDNWEGWEDSAVPPERIGDYLRAFNALKLRYGYRGSTYGHLGDGCVHTRLDWDTKTREGIDQWRNFVDEAADIVIGMGGSLSGEHGDGQARAELLPKMFGPELIRAFEEFKSIWDPDRKMNPGKVVRPYRIDQNLRYGTSYNPVELHTHFQFPDDQGSFVRATERCVGAGACRKEDGVMCPSYMVTREESNVTRGRAHLLNEMLRGNPVRGGWKNEEVKEALDLCLACKGCKGECPVHVDVATYKAEFLSHYYEGRLRPRAAYTMGLIHTWTKFARIAPGFANWVNSSPVTAPLVKFVAGVHPDRAMPMFAKQTFKSWFFKDHRTISDIKRKSVILWADTFTNNFSTHIAKAAVHVLEDAGFSVEVVQRDLCCGRPLYDWGMLDKAKRLLLDILDALKNKIEEGIPIVVLEPSCASVFRDELLNLLPYNENAQRLAKQTFLLAEFLSKYGPDYSPPNLEARAIVQGHCHQTSTMSMEEENSILDRMGIQRETLDAGCCGMAGAFGFEKKHYDISQAVGERKLFPKLRSENKDAIIVADGFSCREQITQATGRKALHLAEVIDMVILNRTSQQD